MYLIDIFMIGHLVANWVWRVSQAKKNYGKVSFKLVGCLILRVFGEILMMEGSYLSWEDLLSVNEAKFFDSIFLRVSGFVLFSCKDDLMELVSDESRRCHD